MNDQPRNCRPLTAEEEERYGADLDRAIARMREERGAEHARPASDAPWFIVQANPNCERRAALSLADLGFEVWVPEVVREIRVGRPRPKNVNACKKFPVAGGLVLARHANPQAWTGLHKADGVYGVAMQGERPAMALDGGEQGVRAWRQSLVPLPVPLIDVAVRIGDVVRITEGPFLTWEGPVERLLGKGAAQVTLQVFGRSTPVAVAAEQLEKVA